MLVSRWGVERLEQRRHVWMWDGDSSDVCQWPRCSQLSIGPHWGFLLPLGLENSLQYKGRSATGSHTAVWRSSRKVVMVQRTLWWSPSLPKTPPVLHSLSSSFTGGSKFQVVFPFDFTGVLFCLSLNVMLILNCATMVIHELQTTSRLRQHLHVSSQSTSC